MHLQLPTLKFRRMRRDMIEVLKLTHNIYDESVSLLSFCTRSNTRGNNYKLRLLVLSTPLVVREYTNLTFLYLFIYDLQ